MKHHVFFAGLALSVVLVIPTSSAEKVTETTLCELIAQADRFDKQIVRVRADVESDLIEHTILVDQSCESKGVSLWIPHDKDDEIEVRKLRSALKDQWKSRAKKGRVVAVFTGVFVHEGKKRFLKVSQIADLEVINN
jgi:hypothetical protein